MPSSTGERGSGAGFRVVIEELRTSASHAETAARSSASIKPGHNLASAASAIPGAGGADLLAQVDQKWDRDLTAWRDRIHGYALRLDIAAARYQRGDDIGAQEFSTLKLGPS